MINVAIMCLAVGLILAVVWLVKRRTVRALEETAQFNSRELGGIPLDGDVKFVGLVEVNGQALTGPLSGTEGVWWRTQVTDHWEEETSSEDSDGNRTTHWENRSQVVSEDFSNNPFLVSDQLGRVPFHPEAVNFRDVERTFYDRQSQDKGVTFKISFGSRTRDHWRETEEWVFPHSVAALALAHVGQDKSGNRFLHKGSGNHSPFIVATDNPDEFAAAVERGANRWGYAACALVTLGLIVAAVGLAG